MLFDSSIRRELTRTFSATLFVLLIIVLTMMLIKSLNIANKGQVNPSEVTLVMGYMSLAYLPSILSLSLFISIVYTLSRMYRDSEMDIWFAAGQGLVRFIKPTLQFALPVVVVITVLSLVGWPWANAQSEQLVKSYQNRGDIERIAPGRFQESQNGSRVFYIDNNDKASAAEGVSNASRLFVFAQEPNKDIVISAATGRVEIRGDHRYAILNNGQATEIHPDRSLNISNFQEYGARIGNKPVDVTSTNLRDPSTLAQIRPRTVSTQDLLSISDPRFQGELGWRLGLALSSLNFVLLALAATRVNPRSGRSGSLIVALLLFAAYFNLLNFGQNWVASGKTSLLQMLMALHGGVFILCTLWLYKRHFNWSWGSWLRRTRSAR